MDNLTHSLIGAVLGQAGLKRRTGLAMPALIIAANLPDIDAPCSVYGTLSLAMRRGLTHGPLAMLVLPLALAAILFWFDRWQTQRGSRPAARLPVRFGWLLALCYIGTLTHPLFDWMNSYGIRLLAPFSQTWFYGDALFIVDPWLLAMLGVGIWLSRKRENAGQLDWRRPARGAIAGGLAYVALNLGISAMAVNRVMADAPYPQVAVANPVPLAFWRREVLWRAADGTYGTIPCSIDGCRVYPLEVRSTGMNDPRLAERARNNPAAQAFLFWSRMPIVEGRGQALELRDQRFMSGPVRGTFSVELPE